MLGVEHNKGKAMYDVLIKQGKLVSGEVVDVAVLNGKIAALGQLDATAKKVMDLAGDFYISAGWIDGHTHCYSKSPIYNDEPDLVGVETGVTTVIDAGSVGADDVDDFYHCCQQVKTNVYSILNISRIGLLRQNELADMADIDGELVKQAVNQYPDFIVGIKARMSGSVVEANGLKPLIKAKEIQRNQCPLPLMVHIGNNPPNLDDVADLLGAGDIITHCYNGKPNRILTAEGELKPSMQRALERGVKLDVGHGGASFSFAVAEQAIKQGIYPDMISSDIYCKNRIHGPVRSLAHIMDKFLAIGLPLQQVIDCVTVNAAKLLKLENKGQLEVGKDADLTFFHLNTETVELVDSDNDQRSGKTSLKPAAAMVAGKIMTTNYGVGFDVFNS